MVQYNRLARWLVMVMTGRRPTGSRRVVGGVGGGGVGCCGRVAVMWAVALALAVAIKCDVQPTKPTNRCEVPTIKFCFK